jgi:dihydroorotase
VDSGPRAAEAIARAREIQIVEIAVAGTLTRGRAGEEIADLDAMYQAGIRVFTDDGDCVANASLLRRIMSYLAALPGALVAEHPEDRGLARDGHINEGAMSALHGLVGIPGVAEDVVVARDLTIARDTGARIHIQHVSTGASVAMIRQARQDGVAVTAEVTPHHLALEDAALVDLDPNLKMYPPLRGTSDRKATVLGLRAGVIDAVATDHAPHSAPEKSLPFEEAPRGVIGLETAAPVVSTALEQDQVTFFERMSRAPARIAGFSRQGIAVEPGSPANLVLFDPTRSWTPAGFASKSGNTPFQGMEMTGKVLATIHEGRITHEGGL